MLRSSFIQAVAAVVVGIATADIVLAQAYATGGYGYAPYHGYGGYPVVAAGTPEGATNYGTGVGLGAYYSGLGDYNYKTGMGLEHREAAREHYLHNRTLAVQTYFERRRINEEYRAAGRPTAVSYEQAATNARKALPKRLDAYRLDPSSGTINWPESLCDERFAELRQRLTKLFAERAETSAGLGTPTQREIGEATEQLQVALREATFKDVTSPLDATAFLPAKKFLDSLAYEARFTPQQSGPQVAAN